MRHFHLAASMLLIVIILYLQLSYGFLLYLLMAPFLCVCICGIFLAFGVWSRFRTPLHKPATGSDVVRRSARKVAAIIGLCLLAFVAYRFMPGFYPAKQARYLPSDQVSCEQHGGHWGRSGFVLLCNFETGDGGKVCSDARQCVGDCLVDEDNGQGGMRVRRHPEWSEPLLPVALRVLLGIPGRCTDWVVTKGCLTYVHNGWVDGSVCID